MYYTTVYLGIFVPILLTITCLYTSILHIALSHIRDSNDHNVFNKNEDDVKSRNARKKHVRNGEMKVTKSLAIVYGAFVVCWVPNFVFVMVLTFKKSTIISIRQTQPNVFWFMYYTLTLVLPVLNVCLNPFIYSISNPKFRKAFRNIINKLLKKHANKQN